VNKVIYIYIHIARKPLVELNPLNTLFTTLYGLFLCIKIGIFLLLLCMGAYNLLRISPSMKHFASSIDEQNGAHSLAAGTLQRSFRRVIGVEVGLMLLVLLAAGALTSFYKTP
jgi:putative copper export protein